MARLHGMPGAAFVLLLLCAACTGSGTGVSNSQLGNHGSATDGAALTGQFTLTVLPESWLDGGSALISLDAHADGDGVVVELLAQQCQGLKALYVDLVYDAASWRPLSADPAASFEQVARTLHLLVTSDLGVVHYGQVLARPQQQAGVSGGGCLARIRFSTAGAGDNRTAVDQALSSLRNVDYTLTWWHPNQIMWLYSIWGDTDQNGEVNIADLTPLAIHLGETVSRCDTVQGLPVFYTGCYDHGVLIDGDHNGLITIGDITAIGANFGHSAVGGFDLYRSQSPVSDSGTAGSSAVPTDAKLVAHVDFNGASVIQESAGQRLTVTFSTPLLPDLYRYWLAVSDPLTTQWYVSTIRDEYLMQLRPPTNSYEYPLLSFNQKSGVLAWAYFSSGDYNQDGMVTWLDFWSLPGLWFDEMTFTDEPYPRGAVSDGDRNGEVNIADLTPFGFHKGIEVTGFNIYNADSLSNFPPSSDAASTIAPLAHVPFSAAIGDPADSMLHFEYWLGAIQAGDYVWVRPHDSLGREGGPLVFGTPWWQDY